MAAALDILLQDWRERLRAWSADGSLASAARHALELGSDDPPLLSELTSQWTEGDFSALPPIVLLPSSSMPGAAGDERIIALLANKLSEALGGGGLPHLPLRCARIKAMTLLEKGMLLPLTSDYFNRKELFK